MRIEEPTAYDALLIREAGVIACAREEFRLAAMKLGADGDLAMEVADRLASESVRTWREVATIVLDRLMTGERLEDIDR